MDGNDAARQALSEVVICIARYLHSYTCGQERAEALTCRTCAIDGDRSVRQSFRMRLRYRRAQNGTYATIYVCDIRMEVHRLHMLARLFRHRNKQGGIQGLFKLHVIFHLWQIMTTCCTRNMGTKFTNRWS